MTMPRCSFSLTQQPILLFFLATAAFAQQNVIFLQPDVCANWTEARDAHEAAMAVWSEPDCYQYTYVFRGFQVGEPRPVSVQVRYGVAGEEEKTMQYFIDMIEDLCIANCPAEGAETCIVSYAAEGYPVDINIDMSRYMADETRSYAIYGFEEIECNVGSLVEGPNNSTTETTEVSSRCAFVEQLIADMEQASKQWTNPECYDFVYEKESDGPVTVKVRSGVATDGEKSIEDYMDMIQTDCVDRCMEEENLDSTVEYACTINFSEGGEGYPVLIQMDPMEEGGGDFGENIRISDLTVLECDSATVEGQPDSTATETTQEDIEDTPEPPADSDPSANGLLESTSSAIRYDLLSPLAVASFFFFWL